MLVLAAPDRQQMVEAQSGFALPEGEHRIDLVGGKADIDLGLRQFHGITLLLSRPS
jgi:hypothetical protein